MTIIRENGFYWIKVGNKYTDYQEPVEIVAQWEHGEWWFIEDENSFSYKVLEINEEKIISHFAKK